MTKSELRKQVLVRRDALPADELDARSQAIWERLRALPEFQAAKCVMFFANFGSEVRTLPMIQQALCLGKRVALPRCLRGRRELDVREVCNCTEHLRPGVWGIPEPRPELCNPVALCEIDLLIAPGVAFDEHGHRLGYGGGFYDLFLKLLMKERPNTPVVALAFELQIVDNVPVGPDDVPIALILTENRMIDNRGKLPGPARHKATSASEPAQCSGDAESGGPSGVGT